MGAGVKTVFSKVLGMMRTKMKLSLSSIENDDTEKINPAEPDHYRSPFRDRNQERSAYHNHP